MVYRTVDDDGDMIPIRSNADMSEATEAVMAAVNSRLRLLHGEWWEDPEIGFLVPEFLLRGTRIAEADQMLGGYITSFILQTRGVTSVTNVRVRRSGRHLFYSSTVVTEYGESVEEVSQDVLLRAVY